MKCIRMVMYVMKKLYSKYLRIWSVSVGLLKGGNYCCEILYKNKDRYN